MLSKKPNKEAEAIISAALIKCSTRHFDRNEFSSAYGKIFMEKNAVAFSLSLIANLVMYWAFT